VLVTWWAGGAAGAYFHMAWTIANALKLITTQMTLSLTVEGARDQAKLDQQGRRFLRSLLTIFVPAVLLTVVTAPLLLRLSGSDYASEGARVLQLMALSVLPGLVTLLYLGIARVRDHYRAIILVQGLFCLLLLGSSWWLLPEMGIVGVGWALLGSEIVVAALVFVMGLWPVWRNPL
jgi:O-antigen/teichoic acid export membrane protein